MLRTLALPTLQEMWHRYARLPRFQGVGLFSTMLALTVLALIVLLISEQVAEYDFRQRQKTVATDLEHLTDATTDLVTRGSGGTQNFNSFEDEVVAAGGILGLTPQALIDDGTLRSSFAQTNALGQTYAIYVRQQRSSELDILVTTVTPTNLPISYNFVALRNYNGNGYIGIIRPTATTGPTPRPRNPLVGPGLSADVNPWRHNGRTLSVGETAVITTLTIKNVLNNFLYRKPQAGYADATKMETDLDLGDHNLVGAGEIRARTLTIEQQLEVLGGVNVMRDLLVGTRLKVDGSAELKAITADSATFSSTVSTEDLTVTSTTTAKEIEVTNKIKAKKADFSVSVSAPRLTAGTLNTQDLTASDIEIKNEARLGDLVANRLIVEGEVKADTAIINDLSVGGCTGC